jgi:hypothetical protein
LGLLRRFDDRHIAGPLTGRLHVGQIVVDDAGGEETDYGNGQEPQPWAASPRRLAVIAVLIVAIGAIVILGRSPAPLRSWRFLIFEYFVHVLIISGATPAGGNWRPAAAVVAKGWTFILLSVSGCRQRRSAAV